MSGYTFVSCVIDQYGSESFGEISCDSEAEAVSIKEQHGADLRVLGWEYSEADDEWSLGAERVILSVENDEGETVGSLAASAPEAIENEAGERVWNAYDACAAVEGFDGQEHEPDELLEAWQYLVNTGLCWRLQGWYGRTAAGLIEAGLIERAQYDDVTG